MNNADTARKREKVLSEQEVYQNGKGKRVVRGKNNLNILCFFHTHFRNIGNGNLNKVIDSLIYSFNYKILYFYIYIFYDTLRMILKCTFNTNRSIGYIPCKH